MWLPLKGSVWQEYDHKGKARFPSPFFGMGRGEHKEFSVEVSLCAILQTEECISAENIFSSSVRGNFLASKSKEPWKLWGTSVAQLLMWLVEKLRNKSFLFSLSHVIHWYFPLWNMWDNFNLSQRKHEVRKPKHMGSMQQKAREKDTSLLGRAETCTSAP